jgi:TrmH family RNA methyltransferase
VQDAAAVPSPPIAVVLVRPQKADNVAGVVRAMANMGLDTLRLVEPAAWDPVRARVAAHARQNMIERVRLYPTLEAALADAVHVVGTTARPRAVRLPSCAPRVGAPDVWRRASQGLVALVFGPEDTGLTNADLDHCHTLWHIPADAAFPSLNLAQSVLLVAYELWLARPTDRFEEGPRSASPVEPARPADVERLLALSERVLRESGFLKPAQERSTLRRLRALLRRADPDARDLALLLALQSRLLRALERSRGSL